MILRRVLLVITVALLLAVSGVVGIVAADWPFWKRSLAISQLKDGGEWPESFYQPVARIDGGGQGAFFPAAAPGEATIDPAALEAAAAWAEANNSAALLVLHDGRVQFERYWQGMSAEQLFSGRALSRSLVGLAFGFAVAEGRLALDDPAGKHLEEWRDDARGRITLRQLLQNISGLEEVPLTATVAPPGASWWQRADALRESYLGKNARLALGSDSAGVALSFGLTEPPGSRFAFSNTNSQVLGVILERATGEPYERFVESRLWRLLGAGVGEFYMDRANGMPAVYCCYRATPRDFLRLGALLVDDGRFQGRQVLPAGWVARLAETSSANPLYGLQVWAGKAPAGLREYSTGSGVGIRHGEAYLADDVLWMEGGGGRTLWAIPSRGLVILRLGRASPSWDASVLPNTILRGLRPAAAPAP